MKGLLLTHGAYLQNGLGKCMAPFPADTPKGTPANIVQTECAPVKGQNWKLLESRNLCNDLEMCLGVERNLNGETYMVQWYKTHVRGMQYVYKEADRSLTNMWGRCMDVATNLAENNAAVMSQKCDPKNKGQQWYFIHELKNATSPSAVVHA